MNAFEKRMDVIPRDQITGPLARALTDFRRLEGELAEARWQAAAGVIDSGRFAAVCTGLDARLDGVRAFLEHYRASVERWHALEKTVDRELNARSTTACRVVMEPLAQWFKEFEGMGIAAVDPSFHVHLDQLLEIAQETVDRHVAGTGRAPIPADPPPVPGVSAGQDSTMRLRAAARADTLRALTAADASAEGQNLSQRTWQVFRDRRAEVERVLSTDRSHEAFWLALDLGRWLEDVIQERTPLLFTRPAAREKRFRDEANLLAAALSPQEKTAFDTPMAN